MILKTIWKSSMSKKCKLFAWSLLHGCINTAEKLWKRLSQWCLNPNRCVLCKTHFENINHIFTTCAAAIFIWIFFFFENLLNWHHDNKSIANLCEHICRFKTKKKQKMIHLLQYDCHIPLDYLAWQKQLNIQQQSQNRDWFMGRH